MKPLSLGPLGGVKSLTAASWDVREAHYEREMARAIDARELIELWNITRSQCGRPFGWRLQDVAEKILGLPRGRDYRRANAVHARRYLNRWTYRPVPRSAKARLARLAEILIQLLADETRILLLEATRTGKNKKGKMVTLHPTSAHYVPLEDSLVRDLVIELDEELSQSKVEGYKVRKPWDPERREELGLTQVKYLIKKTVAEAHKSLGHSNPERESGPAV